MKITGMPICICGIRADEHIDKKCQKAKKIKRRK